MAATPVVLAAVSVGGGLASTLIPSHAATGPLAAPGFGTAAPTRILALREPPLPGSARLQLGSSVRGLDELTQRSTTLSLAIGQGRSEPGSSALGRRAPVRGSGTVRAGAAVRVATPARTGHASAASPDTPHPKRTVPFAVDSDPGPVAPRVVPTVPSETHRVSGGSEGVPPAPVLADLDGTQMVGAYEGRRHASPGRRSHSHRPTGSSGTGTRRSRGSGGRTSPASPAATSTTITEPDLTPTTTGAQTATPPTSGNGGDTGATSPAATSIDPATAAVAATPATTTSETPPPPPTTAPEATPTTTGTQTTSPPPTSAAAVATTASTTGTGPAAGVTAATTATTTDTPSPTVLSTLPAFQTPAPGPSTGSQTTSAAAIPNSSAQVYVATDGNDATCARNNPNAPCATLDEADAIAQPGDTIQVGPGTYGSSTPDYGYGEYILHSTPATYVCAPGAAADSVTFSDPGFLIGPGGGNVTFTGDCFHFHVLVIGLRGYSGAGNEVSTVTLNGVHVDSFDITGVDGVTLENSQIGPIDACFGIGQAASYGAPASAECSPSNPTEAYWATQPDGTIDGNQDEPFVHNNGPDDNANTNLENDTFVGMQTKWPDYFHQGGLLVWGTTGLTIENSTFENNTIYNVEFGSGDNTNTDLIDNTFGAAVYTLADSNPGAALPPQQCQDGLDAAGGNFTNDVVQGNTWVQCMEIGTGNYSGTVVTDNTIGPYPNCPATPGVTYTGNTSAGQLVCGDAPEATATG